LGALNLLAHRWKRWRDRREFFFRDLNRVGLFQAVAGDIADDDIVGTNYSPDLTTSVIRSRISGELRPAIALT